MSFRIRECRRSVKNGKSVKKLWRTSGQVVFDKSLQELALSLLAVLVVPSVVCYCPVMSVTYQPKKRKRARAHGFLKRTSSPGGKRVVARRRSKGRTRLTA